MTGIRFSLDRFEEFVKSDYIPKAIGAESPIRKKIINFLQQFVIGEIKELKCLNKDEAKTFQSRIKYYSRELLPRFFGVFVREIDNEFWLYVKRKEDVEIADKELHNINTS